MLVKHGVNRGLGCAVKTGVENARGDVIIILDADFTFHPSHIPELYNAYLATGYDCIIGSHFGKGGKTEGVPFHRLLLSKAINLLYSIIIGKKVSSISSIFRLYRAEKLKEITIETSGFDINAEILFKLIQRKAKIMEVPVVLTTRKYGESKIRISKEISNNLKLLNKVLLWRMKYLLGNMR
jgi:glycosyltransferase involved in cell wall biosynthesis